MRKSIQGAALAVVVLPTLLQPAAATCKLSAAAPAFSSRDIREMRDYRSQPMVRDHRGETDRQRPSGKRMDFFCAGWACWF